MKKIILCLSFLITFASTITAQERILIRGKVSDELLNPLPQASVVQMGTTNGTLTDSAGNFSLAVPSNSVLQIAYVGFFTQEIRVSSANTDIEVMLLPNNMMDSVVVVGYGTQRKETVTGAISTISDEALVRTPVANVTNMLVGQVPGINSLQASGEPGMNASTIRIRGLSTTNANGQEPLVVIDGIQNTFEVLNGIDPNEVDNISVLKDASATAVYGVKGANGVIIVTTKRGRSGRPQVNITQNFGATQLSTQLNLLGSYEYALFRNEALINDFGNDPSNNQYIFTENELWKFKNNRDYTPDEIAAMNITEAQKQALLNSPALYYSNHNYFDEMLGKIAPQYQTNINISGGTENVKYFTSVGYFNQQGLFRNSNYGGANINSQYDRYNFRSNFDFNLMKYFTLTVDISSQFAKSGGMLGYDKDGDPTSQYARYKSIMGNVLMSPPYAGPGIIDGKLVSSYVTGTNPLEQRLGAWGRTPITSLYDNPYMERYFTNLNGNVRLKHTMDYLTKGLSLTGTVSYNDNYIKGVSFQNYVPSYAVRRSAEDPNELIFYGGTTAPTTIQDYYRSYKWRRMYFEAAANYTNNFGKHAVTALFLGNAQKTYAPDLLYNVPAGLMGFAGRATYDYDRRYLAEVNFGYNGSENFPEGKRFGFFPAFSVGWVVSNENFIPKNDILSYLKIRASYGEVGNDLIGGRRFLYLPSTWGYVSNWYYSGYYFGNSNGSSKDPYYEGSVETSVGNPNVTWERALKKNVGLELNMFRNRLSFVGDVFHEKRNNILWLVGTIPGIVGSELPPANIGKVTNGGYEIQLGWTDNVNDFRYGVKFNMAYAKNRIDFIAEPPYPYAWMNQTGYSIGQYKGYISDGFYNSAEEAAQHINSTSFDGNRVQAGDIRYKDLNGDGILDARDMAPIGYSNLPRYNFSSNINFGYKGFSVNLLFIGAAQGSIMLTDLYIRNPFYMRYGAAMQWQYDGRWTPEKAAQGITPTYPRASIRTNDNINGLASDFWLLSTDFIRFKNAELSYTFQNLHLFNKLNISNLKLYVNGNNLATWDKLIPGIDPEQSDTGGASSGYVYPMTRIYNFGINVQF